MVVVGFDVGKTGVTAARLDKSGRVKEHRELANTKTDLLPLLHGLREHYAHLLIASEATAEYHRALAELCLDLDIPFHLINPITTKQFTRATVRKKKTDTSDAEVVARLAAQGQGTPVTRETFTDVKPVLRTAVKLVQMNHSLALMQRHLAAVLPETDTLPGQLDACREQIDAATDVLRGAAVRRVDPELSRLLQSVPGVGPQTAVLLIAELGDITRFANAKAVIAYAGLDPKVKQSGASLRRNTRLTKRGSPYLRRALYLAANSARRHDPELKAVYDKKRAEGKRHKQATIVVARKIATRVYAVWRRGTPYR